MNALRRSPPLGNFVDTLVQGFENRRAGLPDELDPARVEGYFRELYELERPRLAEAVRAFDAVLSEEALAAQLHELDQLVVGTLIPAYARLAREVTRRERNDFYLAPGPYHALERVGWAVGGIVVGAFVVWAPFIPIWSKEAVLPFALGGLFLPELRKLARYRIYARDVNRLVGRIEDEARRLQSAYLSSDGALGALTAHAEPTPQSVDEPAAASSDASDEEPSRRAALRRGQGEGGA